MMIGVEFEIRELSKEEIHRNLLDHFDRHQVVTEVWRRTGNLWKIQECPFTEEWYHAEKRTVIGELHGVLNDNGAVVGAYNKSKLIGFASIKGRPIGDQKEYLQLQELHVSFGYRGYGLGRKLFAKCCDKAREKGAEKLYISSHSSIETIAFYRQMGCVNASWHYKPQIELEPYDVQMEYELEG